MAEQPPKGWKRELTINSLGVSFDVLYKLESRVKAIVHFEAVDRLSSENNKIQIRNPIAVNYTAHFYDPVRNPKWVSRYDGCFFVANQVGPNEFRIFSSPLDEYHCPIKRFLILGVRICTIGAKDPHFNENGEPL